MRNIGLILLISSFLISCGTNQSSLSSTKNSIPHKIDLVGKFVHTKDAIKVYFDDDLKKIVLSDGCQVVSANFQRFDPAISFKNINATQLTCVKNQNLEQILRETILIESKGRDQIVLKNKNLEELLILSKN